MTVPTINMVAPSTFGGVVEGTPTGTVYTAVPGQTIAVQYPDIGAMTALGFQNVSGSVSQNPLVASVNVAASPALIVNNTGAPETVILGNTGGISALALIRGGITTVVNDAIFSWRLAPGDTLKVTWSSTNPTQIIVPG